MMDAAWSGLMTGAIDYQLTGRVATITINRPQALNALTDAMHHELAAAYRRFQADGEAWVGVVRGAPAIGRSAWAGT